MVRDVVPGLQANLLLAASGLSVVRLLRSAMNGGAPPSGLGPAPNPLNQPGGAGPRIVAEPDLRIEPRKVIDPAPRFNPRPVITPSPAWTENLQVGGEPRQPEIYSRLTSPIEPVWKTLPLEQTTQPSPQVKINIIRPDIVSKGMLLDLFI